MFSGLRVLAHFFIITLCLKIGGINDIFIFGYKTQCMLQFLKAYNKCDVMVGYL